MLFNLTRDELKAYAIGELFLKRKVDGVPLTTEVAELYSEAFLLAFDKLNVPPVPQGATPYNGSAIWEYKPGPFSGTSIAITPGSSPFADKDVR